MDIKVSLKLVNDGTSAQIRCMHCNTTDIIPIVSNSPEELVIDSDDWVVCDEGCCIMCIDCAVQYLITS